jgi:predicted DNA-binding transcriptional regulator AlpA
MLVLHLGCAFGQVIAVNYHPINAKYWTVTANSTEAEGSIAPYRDATFTALETPMALTAMVQQMPLREALLTAEDVAQRLNVTKDWVWDHSSRKAPYLPVIRMSDGVLRYRWSEVEEFVNERERLSSLRRRRR